MLLGLGFCGIGCLGFMNLGFAVSLEVALCL